MTAPSVKGTTLVTGAPSCVGTVHAGRLAWRGCDVILVVRDAQQLADPSPEG